ncbi:MAG: hypothetical protein IBJ13_03895 [Sphingopyxis sp.]|nr:hypothetical protein [Sphingopyxis sp.]
MRIWGGLLLAVAMATPQAARANPEVIDQLEPEGGEWEVEWQGYFGGEGEQGFEALYGLNDHLAIGAEVEFEGPDSGFEFEEVSAVLLYRFTDHSDKPVGFGILGEASITRGGGFAGFSTRAIVERKRDGWWLQGNAILRHEREDGAKGTGLAYAVSAQAEIAEEIWLGFEASGQPLRVSGNPALAPEGPHYVGPSLTIEKEIGDDGEVEIGLAWLERVAGSSAPSGPRVFVQFIF